MLGYLTYHSAFKKLKQTNQVSGIELHTFRLDYSLPNLKDKSWKKIPKVLQDLIEVSYLMYHCLLLN